MAEKYFDHKEAEGLLPLIGSCLEQARKKQQRIEGLNAELAMAAARIMALGGSVPPYRELLKKRDERDQYTAQLEAVIRKIQETGCLVTDVETGVVDFRSRLGGEEVYLCWKLGEERIAYWHGIDEGFAGRKPLDESPPEEPTQGSTRVQ
jgi:hypothetical protein